MKKYINIMMLAFSFVIFLYSLSFSEEQITITTYYPSPYGVYKALRLFPTTQPASGQEGEIYYDSRAEAQGGHSVKYYDGSVWRDIGVPRGTIVMWSGAYGAIPTGWALCNGTNGTPDLMDKFIVSAETVAQIGGTGGVNTYSLTIAQLPAHTHTGSTTPWEGTHSHTMALGDNDNGDCGWGNGADSAGGTCKSLATSFAGEHTHTITINSVGSGAAIDNRPAFYKLAYIMKL